MNDMEGKKEVWTKNPELSTTNVKTALYVSREAPNRTPALTRDSLSPLRTLGKFYCSYVLFAHLKRKSSLQLSSVLLNSHACQFHASRILLSIYSIFFGELLYWFASASVDVATLATGL